VSLKADWLHYLDLSDVNSLLIGAEYEDDEGEGTGFDRASADTLSIFAEDKLAVNDSFYASLGLRYDEHQEFGGQVTYRVGSVYNINANNSRIKGTVGTGFKAPSVYQLYAPATLWGPVGNRDLDPEESLGWDVGYEQTLLGGEVSFGVTYFENSVDDMIDYEFGFVNVAEAVIRGVEADIVWKPIEALVLGLSYTYMDTEDENGDALKRRPENAAQLNIAYECSEKLDLNLSVFYRGETDDLYFDSTMFTSVDVENKEYTLVNIGASYGVNDNVSLTARINNVFDEDYQEAAGYGTPGVSGYAGISVTL
jgi:vitamin B12 transporter